MMLYNSGRREKIFHSNIRESVTVEVESPSGTIENCFIRLPHETDSIDIISKNEKLKKKFKYIGAKNNSCSFVITNITEDSYGEWHVTSRYKSSKVGTLLKHFEDKFVFDITG